MIVAKHVSLFTYENDLVVKSHRSIATANKGNRFIQSCQFREKFLVFDDCCSVRIPVTDSSVPCCQVAIQEAQ